MSKLTRWLLAILFFLALPVWAENPAGAERLSDCDRRIVAVMFDMFELDPATFEIDILSNPYRERMFESEEELILRPLTLKEPLGLFTVAAEIWRDGKLSESRQVRLRVRKFAEVLVTTDRISRHDLLTAANLRLERAEVTTLREKPCRSIDALRNHWAHRSVRRGKILTSGDVEVIPDVQSGRQVTIVYEQGACRITASGTALQSGVRGDQVRIKSKSSGKTIMARVLDEDVVAVDP